MNMTLSKLSMKWSMLYMVVLSSILAFSSTSWLMVWVFMEINSLCMCGVMIKDVKKMMSSPVVAMVYIIIQLSSSIVLLMVLNNMISFEIGAIMGVLCLLLKSGTWPFHVWYIKILNMMEMKTVSMKVLMTWQKLLPFLLLQFFYIKSLIIFLGVMTMIFPVVKLLSSISLKSVLFLSSINNNGWFLISSILSSSIFLVFFCLYSLSLIVSLSFFKNMKSKKSVSYKPFWSSMLVLSNMSGVPPTAMFMVKVLVMVALLMSCVPDEILVLMMMLACLFLYNYFWCVLNQLFPVEMLSKSQIFKKDTLSSLFAYLIVFVCFLTVFAVYLG